MSASIEERLEGITTTLQLTAQIAHDTELKLDKLSETVNKLSETVSRLTVIVVNLAESTQRLAVIVQGHEGRIERLEDEGSEQ
jgi:hypothetical protein